MGWPLSMNGTKNNAKELDQRRQIGPGVCDVAGATQMAVYAENGGWCE